jgi:hypothetical protein
VTLIHRDPSDDERAAIAWWDSLSAPRRADWLQMADSTKPAGAWTEFKRQSLVERAAKPPADELSAPGESIPIVRDPRA